jgi:hypothetical protein
VRYGPGRDLIFLTEIDTIWRSSEAEAAKVLDRYQGMGGNHLILGPAARIGYHHDYPDTDWLSDRAGFERFLRWVADRGLATTLVLAPDHEPFYDGSRFNWTELERFRQFLAALDAPITRTMSQWEQFQTIPEMARLFDWCRALFPTLPLAWHNPPGHSGPGTSSEDEQACWRSAAAHGVTHHYLQAWPPSQIPVPGNAVGPAIDQMAYDLWDSHRRMVGDGSPWGAPVIAKDGAPIRTVFAEGTAFAIYNANYPVTVGADWQRRAATVAGITDFLDGLA